MRVAEDYQIQDWGCERVSLGEGNLKEGPALQGIGAASCRVVGKVSGQGRPRVGLAQRGVRMGWTMQWSARRSQIHMGDSHRRTQKQAQVVGCQEEVQSFGVH